MRSCTLKSPCLVKICACRHKLGLAVEGAAFFRNAYPERSNATRPPLVTIFGSVRVAMNPRSANSKSRRSSAATICRTSAKESFADPAIVFSPIFSGSVSGSSSRARQCYSVVEKQSEQIANSLYQRSLRGFRLQVDDPQERTG